MSELFDSGRVGTKVGSRRSIIKRWVEYGIAELIIEEFREQFSLQAEDVAYIIIKNGDDAYKCNMSTFSIPCLGRVYKEIYENETLEYIEKVEIFDSIDSYEFVSLIDDNFGELESVIKNIHKSSEKIDFDLEAEALAYLSKMIAHKYLFRFKTRSKHKKEFATRYVSILRSSEEKKWMDDVAIALGIKLDSNSFPETKEDFVLMEQEYVKQKMQK